MGKVFEIIFSGPFTFIGTIILIVVLGEAIAKIVKAFK